jgi:hypothetical protein
VNPCSSYPPAVVGSVREVADRCRLAGLEFVNGAPMWDKRDLAAWLVGPYRDATFNGSYFPRPCDYEPPPPSGLGRLIAEARWRVLSVLEAVALDSSAIGRLTAHPAVQTYFDPAGDQGFRPLDVARMRLSDRVLSLFAADARTRPRAYVRGGLAVCALCERVTIGARDTCACAARPQVAFGLIRER